MAVGDLEKQTPIARRATSVMSAIGLLTQPRFRSIL